MKLDKKILELCKFSIKMDLGSLNDLPYELANTIANVYYRYHKLGFSDLKGSKYPYFAPDNVNVEQLDPSEFLDLQKKSMNDYAQFKADIEAVPKMIKNLRELAKRQTPRLYQYMVDFILDCLKYDIKHPEKKTEMRRKIERKIKKGKIKEIPNLIDLIDLIEDESMEDGRNVKHENAFSESSLSSVARNLTEMANESALKQTDILISNILKEQGLDDEKTIQRIKYSLSIANIVINIWVINLCISNEKNAKRLIDEMFNNFFEFLERAHIGVIVGDYIVENSELVYLSKTCKVGTRTATGLSTLTNLIYSLRQEKYMDALERAHLGIQRGEVPNDKYTFYLSFFLTKDIIGKDDSIIIEQHRLLVEGISTLTYAYLNTLKNDLLQLKTTEI